MLQKIFTGLFAQNIGAGAFLICIIAALIVGIFLACIYTYKARYTQSFVITLAVIPAAVCVVILMVNGNTGAGIAAAGAFSLVRFRSVPGTAKEIGAIFISMAAGLTCGIGYVGYAFLFAAVMGAISILYNHFEFGMTKDRFKNKTLHITIPEDLDYTDVFDDLFAEYTDSHSLISVKTTNMGSLFKLTYDIQLKSVEKEKQFIDELRCRNGNLEINITQQSTAVCEL